MKEYETAVVRPTPLRSFVYRMKRELIEARIKKAETEDERQRLIEERKKLETEHFGMMIETR